LSTVHVVLPNDIDDPAAPSGGNVYDRRVCAGLASAGWTVVEHAVAGAWPRPDAAARTGLARVLTGVPTGAVVLVDGLVASCVPDVLVPESVRLRLVVLVHMPLDGHADADVDAEREALAAACAVVTTSEWTRRRLLDRYALPAGRVHVATPGVDPAPLAPGTEAGTRLLCVGAVSAHKGYDLLVDALAMVADRPWTCACVGSLTRDPDFADRLRRDIKARGLADRFTFAGACTGAALDTAYHAADLLVLASRGETYGMVVTEALARGIPVVAPAIGGLPESLGRAPDGSLPGVLVTPGDGASLAGAVRHWLGDAALRERLRRSAHDRRTTLAGWGATAARISSVLDRVPG
jgi:glycosyltransferase involved in cell wall biosynthesis